MLECNICNINFCIILFYIFFCSILILICCTGNSGCGVWILTVSKPLIYGNRIADCGDSGVALVSNSDLHHDNQQLSSQFVQSEQEVSCDCLSGHQLVLTVLSLHQLFDMVSHFLFNNESRLSVDLYVP